MATIIQQPSSFCFSSDIDDIIFSTSYTSGVVLMTFTVNGTAHTVMNETMYPDANGVVRLTDLSSLIEPYVRQNLAGTLACSFTDTGGSASISGTTVLFAMVDVGIPASTFVANHFLSVLNGEKLTAYGREERLYSYGVTTVGVSAYVRMLSGEYNTLTGGLSAISTSNSVSQFNVSPENIAAAVSLTGGNLVSYEITAGNRSQKFRIVNEPVAPAPSLLFVNSFGCQEFIHCVGTHKKDSKYDRQSARFLGKLRNYRVTEDRQFTANTGWLNEAMADWADELFRSQEVYLWVDNAVGREVVVSDSKSEITNDDNDMPAFEFTYGYAQRIHNVMQPSHAGRIFDNTFDETFD